MTLNGIIEADSTRACRKVRVVIPYPITHRFKPGAEFVGKSLLHMLTTKFPFHPAEEWSRRILDKRVFVDGVQVNPDFKLRSGHVVYHHNPAVIEPSVPDEVEVITETPDYLAVFKPAPLPMHQGGRYNKNTLLVMLKERGYSPLHIIHRLDAVTSGLVMLAKNKTFARKAMQLFATPGSVKKSYLAKVEGIPDKDFFEVQSNIRRKQGFVFESGAHVDQGQPAHTKFKVLERYNTSALVQCLPLTGRTHQIRLHLAEAGFPIVDDPIYGPNGDSSSNRPQNTGISLVSMGLNIPALGIALHLPDKEVFQKLIGFATM